MQDNELMTLITSMMCAGAECHYYAIIQNIEINLRFCQHKQHKNIKIAKYCNGRI